jgi:hypothetical protein
MCIRVCHCGPLDSGGYGQIADSVRAGGAVRGTACFVVRRPFFPLRGHLTARRTGACRASRSASSSPSCSRWAVGCSCSYPRLGQAAGSPALSHRGCPEVVTEYASPPLGVDPVEPVVYLSWTDDAPVMYPPYTCADDAPVHEATMPVCGCCERDSWSADAETPSNRTDVPAD